MPRETKTSLFESHITQGLFLTVCLIGIVLVLLIFLQNYKNYKERLEKTYSNKAIELAAKKAARHDLLSSLFISLLIAALLIFLIVVMGSQLISIKNSLSESFAFFAFKFKSY
jgi:Na+/melibiose symporter-like transporter